MNWLIALKYLGTVITIVHQLEAVMADSPGKVKLEAALAILSATDEAVKGVLPELVKLISAIKAVFYPKPVVA